MNMLFLICFLMGFASTIRGQSACNFTSIEACIEPLDQYNIDNDILFPQIKRSRLNQLCNDYNTVEACLEPIKPSCSLYRRRHYEGLEQAYDYICGQGFEVYLENYYCWGDTDLRTTVRLCNATYQADVKDTMENAYIYTHLQLNERVCQHMNDYMFCIKDTVKDKCNSSSANWQHEVNVRSVSPLLQEMNCTIWRPPLNAGEIAGIVIGCVVVVVVIVLLVYYCTCNVDKYRKKQKVYLNEKKEKPKSKSTVGPPPTNPPTAPVSEESATSTNQAERPDTSRRSSLRKKNKTPSNSGRLNLSFADDNPSVRSSQYVGEETYQSLPSYTQAIQQDRSVLSNDQSRLSNDQSYLEESANWEEETQKRPKDVPRLF